MIEDIVFTCSRTTPCSFFTGIWLLYFLFIIQSPQLPPPLIYACGNLNHVSLTYLQHETIVLIYVLWPLERMIF